jgi:hypothetical protein
MYGFTSHLLAIGSFIFLIVYATDHIAHKIAKVAVIIVLVLYLDIDNIYVRSDNANIHETRVDV